MQEGHFYSGLSEFKLAEHCQSPLYDAPKQSKQKSGFANVG